MFATETELTEIQFCQEIDNLTSQISELEKHLLTLRNHPTPAATPQGLTPKEIIKQAQETVQRQQQVATKQAEAEALAQSIAALKGQLAEKRRELKELKAKEAFDRPRCKLLALYPDSSSGEPTSLTGTGGGLSPETVQAIRERTLGVPQHE